MNSKTAKNLRELSKNDKRVKVIHQENQGQAAARNTAVAIAKGEWIHFVDSDDLIHPQMLEILYGAVDETTQISMCGVYQGSNLSESFFSSKSDYSFEKRPINDEELVLMYHEKYKETDILPAPIFFYSSGTKA